MKVLIACECSGVVREAFKKRGHDAWSCDLEETDIPGQHICGCVLRELEREWDLIVAHPPCTYLTCTGNKWFKPEFATRFPNRIQQRECAVEFFMKFANHSCSRIAIENPIGIISSRWRKPDQIIQPFRFGDPARKATALWLKGLPPLLSFEISQKVKLLYCKSGKTMDYEYATQRGKDRAKNRSKTFQGIADAMAAQWGDA